MAFHTCVTNQDRRQQKGHRIDTEWMQNGHKIATERQHKACQNNFLKITESRKQKERFWSFLFELFVWLTKHWGFSRKIKVPFLISFKAIQPKPFPWWVFAIWYKLSMLLLCRAKYWLDNQCMRPINQKIFLHLTIIWPFLYLLYLVSHSDKFHSFWPATFG